ncbi:MAG: ribosome maturation factor RimP [Gemmatimonadetes bacterium]|nr:ribosome maturation factor RimP [Gemmatimonadota bacterium]NNF14949.1 ribosome maturation factor RimP [Gemmatimonadota bacterium]
MRAVPEIDREMERRIDDLGYELVEIRWGGSGKRPMLKVRIDRQDSVPGEGVTVDECAEVSRALEPWLDEHAALSERYVLEVSSPGVDRPLVRGRDFVRFRGEKVAVMSRGQEILADKATRLEGELLGLADEGTDSESVLLRLPDGEEVSVPRSEIRKAHLVFTWK